MENALSSSLKKLTQGPARPSSKLVRGYGSERDTHMPTELSRTFFYLALLVFCQPSGGCSYTPRKLGKCKDFTEMASEEHFEEKFYFFVVLVFC